MALSFHFSSNIEDWKAGLREQQRPVAKAGVAALRDVAATSVQEGREDIAAAGPGFRHAQWQSGLKYRIKGANEGGEPSLNAKATIFHRYGIAGVFEYGATIQGRPLMWIPTTHGAPSPGKSRKKLTSATINGTPVLFDAADKDRKRKPLYIGVPQVDIPKKFHVTEITEKNFENFGVFFFLHFEDNS
jgi:hypothetical protein